MNLFHKKKKKHDGKPMSKSEYNELIRQIERETRKKYKVRPRYNPKWMRARGKWNSIYDPKSPRFAYSIMEFHTSGMMAGQPKKVDVFCDRKIAQKNPKLEKKIVRHELREVMHVQHGMPVHKAHQKAVRGEREDYASKRTRLGHDLRRVYLSIRGKKDKKRKK